MRIRSPADATAATCGARRGRIHGKREHLHLAERVAKVLIGIVSVALVWLATFIAPSAKAQTNPMGNFDLIIPDRFDFHTWVWAVTPCINGAAPVPECVHVFGIARPIAKAFNYQGDAQLVEGRYTFTTDDPYGLRCGNVYYGPTVVTHDVYSWDASTMAGTLVSSFEAGCDGAPGTLVYPISLARL